jgi:U4/U6.U5 tri-snRNP-associated protein 3
MPKDHSFRTKKEEGVGKDNVESYRSRTREKDRRRREDNYEDNNWNIKIESDLTTASSLSSHDYESERQRRMARLREELKQEDEDMVALDQEAFAAGAAADGTLGKSSIDDAVKPQETIIQVREEELEGLDEEEQMRKLMGIECFGSTKGQKVEDNHQTSARGVAAKNKARKYRQYMNRKNGFNRPLEKMK